MSFLALVASHSERAMIQLEGSHVYFNLFPAQEKFEHEKNQQNGRSGLGRAEGGRNAGDCKCNMIGQGIHVFTTRNSVFYYLYKAHTFLKFCFVLFRRAFWITSYALDLLIRTIFLQE